MTVGIVALQGDFQKHADAVASLGAIPKYVRLPGDLDGCERLIIPGGESTTLKILMRRHGLDHAIRSRASEAMPVWGTCMGMILLAQRIQGRDEGALGLMDVEVERNAFGSQVHSFEEWIEVCGLQEPFHAVFIRAPAVTSMGQEVSPLATARGRIVAVVQGKLLGTSFHPELTPDRRMHELFLAL